MELQVETHEGVRVITLPALPLDASRSNDFRQEVGPHLAGQARVVLDLSKLTTIDSSGLGVLLSCLRQANAAGGDLRLGAVPPHIKLVMEMVRMHKVFRLFETTAAAVESFR